MMKKYITTASLLMLSLATSAVFAKVTSEKAEQLGKNLTPLGAEMAANAAGTIPAWTGGLTSKNTTKSADSGRPANPFTEDKVLFEITSANFSDYQANLSAGQINMFEKYADYKMPIYKTRRTAAYSNELYDIVKKNATTAELVQSGNGIANFKTTIPFPLAENGSEVIWNHITRYRGGTAKRFLTTIPVQANGSFVPVKMNDQLVWPEFLQGGRDDKKDANILFYYLQQITAPSRLTGTALLVHETIDPLP